MSITAFVISYWYHFSCHFSWPTDWFFLFSGFVLPFFFLPSLYKYWTLWNLYFWILTIVTFLLECWALLCRQVGYLLGSFRTLKKQFRTGLKCFRDSWPLLLSCDSSRLSTKWYGWSSGSELEYLCPVSTLGILQLAAPWLHFAQSCRITLYAHIM